MTMGMPKPVGEIDSVVARWEVAPLRRFLRGIDQGWSPTADDRRTEPDEWAVLKLSAVNRGTFRPEEHKALPAELEPIRRLEVRQGDLLLTRANTPELVGDACVVPEVRPNLMMSDLIYRLRLDTDRLDPRFTQYWLLSSPGRDQIARDARGSSQSMVKISQQTVRSWLIPLPELDEQRAIADYLDEKTAAVDALIAKRERQVQLLDEGRKAAISERLIVRLGGGSLVPSEYDWLGPVPDHWTVIRLKFALQSVEQGWSPSCENRPAEEDEWGVMKAGCVNGTDFDQNDNKALPAELEPLTQYEIRAGDVLLSRANTRTLLGSAAYVREVRPKLLLCDKLYRLSPRPGMMDPEFLAHALTTSTARYQFERDATGSSASMQNIGQDTVRNLILPLPPLHEQRAIVAGLERELGHLEQMRRGLISSIEKLREYRQTLISAAVTGQIPIREEVPA